MPSRLGRTRKGAESMALFDCKLYSHVLHQPVHVSVYAPDRKNFEMSDFDVVLLLHGMCCDGKDFFLRTGIADYADGAGAVLVAPSCGNNYFADGVNGLKYETYLFCELLPYLRKTFGLSDLREKNFILGVSMGAFAAVRLGLTYPERFKAVCSLSAPIDLKTAVETLRDNLKDCRRRAFCSVYGSVEQFAASDSDIMRLIKLASPSSAPFVYLYAGRNDPLLPLNERVAETMRARGMAVALETDDGAHDWQSWDRQAKKFIETYVGK